MCDSVIEHVPWSGAAYEARAPTKSRVIRVVKAVNMWNQTLEELSADLQVFPVIGFDMEWLSKDKLEQVMVERVSEGKDPWSSDEVVAWNIQRGAVAMIQLSSCSGHTILFRSCYFKELPPSLVALLQNKDVLKVGVGIHQDMQRLEADWHTTLTGYVDLRFLVGRMPEFQGESVPPKMSLKALTTHIFGPDVEWDCMRTKLSDWSTHWLNADQVSYASKDSQAAIDFFIWGLPSVLEVKNDELWSQLDTYAQPMLHFLRSKGWTDRDYGGGNAKKKKKPRVFKVRRSSFGSSSEDETSLLRSENPDPSLTQKPLKPGEFSDRLVSFRLDTRRTFGTHDPQKCEYSNRTDNFVGVMESEYSKSHGLHADPIVACFDLDRLAALGNCSILIRNRKDHKGARKMLITLKDSSQPQPPPETCIICGRKYEDTLVTYSIVPEGYRDHYNPSEYALCTCNHCKVCHKCLPRMHQFELKMRQVVAEVCKAEIGGYPRLAIDERLRILRQKAVWLRRFRQNDAVMTHEEAASYLAEIFEYYGYDGRNTGDKQLAEDLIDMTVGRSYLVCSDQPSPLTHERSVVECFLAKYENRCVEAYATFEHMWRQIFVSSVKPKGLPEGWKSFHDIANCPAVANALKQSIQMHHEYGLHEMPEKPAPREKVQNSNYSSQPAPLAKIRRQEPAKPVREPESAPPMAPPGNAKPFWSPKPAPSVPPPRNYGASYRAKDGNTVVPVVQPLVINLDEQSDEEDSQGSDTPVQDPVSDEDSDVSDSDDFPYHLLSQPPREATSGFGQSAMFPTTLHGLPLRPDGHLPSAESGFLNPRVTQSYQENAHHRSDPSQSVHAQPTSAICTMPGASTVMSQTDYGHHHHYSVYSPPEPTPSLQGLLLRSRSDVAPGQNIHPGTIASSGYQPSAPHFGLHLNRASLPNEPLPVSSIPQSQHQQQVVQNMHTAPVPTFVTTYPSTPAVPPPLTPLVSASQPVSLLVHPDSVMMPVFLQCQKVNGQLVNQYCVISTPNTVHQQFMTSPQIVSCHIVNHGHANAIYVVANTSQAQQMSYVPARSPPGFEQLTTATENVPEQFRQMIPTVSQSQNMHVYALPNSTSVSAAYWHDAHQPAQPTIYQMASQVQNLSISENVPSPPPLDPGPTGGRPTGPVEGTGQLVYDTTQAFGYLSDFAGSRPQFAGPRSDFSGSRPDFAGFRSGAIRSQTTFTLPPTTWADLDPAVHSFARPQPSAGLTSLNASSHPVSYSMSCSRFPGVPSTANVTQALPHQSISPRLPTQMNLPWVPPQSAEEYVTTAAGNLGNNEPRMTVSATDLSLQPHRCSRAAATASFSCRQPLKAAVAELVTKPRPNPVVPPPLRMASRPHVHPAGRGRSAMHHSSQMDPGPDGALGRGLGHIIRDFARNQPRPGPAGSSSMQDGSGDVSHGQGMHGDAQNAIRDSSDESDQLEPLAYEEDA